MREEALAPFESFFEAFVIEVLTLLIREGLDELELGGGLYLGPVPVPKGLYLVTGGGLATVGLIIGPLASSPISGAVLILEEKTPLSSLGTFSIFSLFLFFLGLESG